MAFDNVVAEQLAADYNRPRPREVDGSNSAPPITEPTPGIFTGSSPWFPRERTYHAAHEVADLVELVNYLDDMVAVGWEYEQVTYLPDRMRYIIIFSRQEFV